jgi:predicted transcriptional regulator
MKDETLTMAEIAKRLEIGRTTLYRALNRAAGHVPRQPGRKPSRT